MSNIDKAFDAIESFCNRNLAVKKNRCLSSRNRNSGCTRCVEVCPAQCISRNPEDGSLYFEGEKCLSCGTCATACPTGALTVKNPSEEDLYQKCLSAAQQNNGKVVVLCQPLAQRAGTLVDAEKVAVVPCYGRLDESFLLALVRRGISSVTLCVDACNACQFEKSAEMAKTVQQNVAALMEAWEIHNPLRVVDKIPGSVRASKDSYDGMRRGFFSDVKEGFKDAAGIGASAVSGNALDSTFDSEPLEHVNEEGTLNQSLPLRQTRLIKTLSELGIPPKETKITTRLWGQVHVDAEKCQACMMCATFCPTGALKRFTHHDGSFGITIQPALCVQCKTCETICMNGALTVSNTVRAQYIVKGTKANFRMKERPIKMNQPNTATLTMRKVLGVENVFDR